MTATSEPSGTSAVAMAHAARLLDVNPELAAEQAQAQARWAAAQFELGLALAGLGRSDKAMQALQRAVDMKSGHTGA